ncbi:MAG: ABC transporter ATP-binding protein [Gammaproteobacteria bacterium]|nr:ABC transporter ATP-binding protein [Gammaproteobacteria bacterium]
MSLSSPDSVLQISDLRKRYGPHEVLRGLQLEVKRGAIHGLVGLNGSGKTTTLECVLGLRSFDSGSVSVLGQAPRNIHMNRSKVVAIFDTPSLNPALTVDQTLRHAALLCGLPRSRIDEVKKLLGIETFGRFRIRHLSLGNKRRASIAQGLLGYPELVLLDEPFNGLDAGGVDDVLVLIHSLNQELGTSFLLSSHQLPYLEQICSHLAILHQGQIAVDGNKTQLLEQFGTILHIRVSDPQRSRQLLAAEADVKLLASSSEQLLKVEIGDKDPAIINALLVKGGVSVSELIPKGASLEALFRQVISSPGHFGSDTVSEEAT